MRATVDRPGLDSQGRSPLINLPAASGRAISPRSRDVIEQALRRFLRGCRYVRVRARCSAGPQYVHHRWLMEPWGCFVAEASPQPHGSMSQRWWTYWAPPNTWRGRVPHLPLEEIAEGLFDDVADLGEIALPDAADLDEG